jgi:Protein of unknown function (DUF3431)
MKKHDNMLVVARYNEDVSWTREFDKKIIYNKGDISTIPDDLKPFVVNLPNVGREAHTYLYHIVTHYDTLDDLTIFTQGRFTDHFIYNLDHFKSLVLNTTGYSKNFFDSRYWGNNSRNFNFNLDNWGTDLGKKTNENLGQWHERVFNEPFRESPYIYMAAIFSVGKEYIRNRSKEFYIKLLNELSYHNAPVEAHFMERNWVQTFKIPV